MSMFTNMYDVYFISKQSSIKGLSAEGATWLTLERGRSQNK